MGRTSKPLIIVALSPCDTWEELDKLEKQGHTVARVRKIENGFSTNIEPATDLISLLLDADIVLGPNCWRMDTQHKPYLTLALKESRMLKYDTYEKRADSKTRASVAADLDTGSGSSTD